MAYKRVKVTSGKLMAPVKQLNQKFNLMFHQVHSGSQTIWIRINHKAVKFGLQNRYRNVTMF